MVHRREVDGEPIVLGNHGALWGNAMTWWDHSTGSVWSQPLGEAIAGPRKGQTVELLPSTFTTWTAWREAHPDTLALDKFTRDTRFTLDQIAVVIIVGDDTLAIPMPALRNAGLIEVDVGGEPTVVVLPPNGSRALAFSREVDGTVLRFVPAFPLTPGVGYTARLATGSSPAPSISAHRSPSK